MHRLLLCLLLLMVALGAWFATSVSRHHDQIREVAGEIQEAVHAWVRDPSSDLKRTVLEELASAKSEWMRGQLYAAMMFAGYGRTFEFPEVARGAVGLFRRGLADPAPIVRTEACKGIATSQLVASLMVDDLIKVVQTHKDSPISWYAADALGMSGTNRADVVELLAWGLQFPTSRPLLDGRFNQNQGLRDYCVDSLARLGVAADAAHDELAKYLSDLDQLFRSKVAFAMISIRADSPQAMDAILKIRDDPNAEVAARDHATTHLAKLRRPHGK